VTGGRIPGTVEEKRPDPLAGIELPDNVD